ncbi:N-acetylglucosamine kinase [Pseudoneobacillus rhizosphaerae]|uniref:N-acetylmuramic acid/N-acetylglucosamine kinase n=1 Tax=Pseudoneobacillus rhizosphaerae TaxID=2880968 RepID=A0A9C7GAQ9_9BACI|nr:BadF/BadG/BcrA/BcrD ATPase family protein [Pseudoneobacillus rhizosphaerae]CAG9609126.1 N-acetylmuramic acid/N-acetylglucosamine kinase [Pseudoneobacillus rhizosphaerae]
MVYIMGVDGGGSKTYCVICDERGERIGFGLAGCGNYQMVGINDAYHNIQSSIQSALSDASLKIDDISFVQFGLAGADRPKDFAILNNALEKLGFNRWDLVCDTMEGLRTGSPTNIGVVLICGSGTNSAGRNSDGATAQTGGFGYLYGDWAGGYSMAQETFRTAVRSHEMRESPSLLTQEVPKFFGFNSMGELLQDFLDRDVTSVPADLTQLLHQVADKHDPLAISILEKTGKELGLAAISVIKKLGKFETTIPIVLTGSVLQKGKNKSLLDSILTTVKMEISDVELIIPNMEPVYGSVMLAMDHLGLPVTDDIMKKFEEYGGYEK